MTMFHTLSPEPARLQQCHVSQMLFQINLNYNSKKWSNVEEVARLFHRAPLSCVYMTCCPDYCLNLALTRTGADSLDQD